MFRTYFRKVIIEEFSERELGHKVNKDAINIYLHSSILCLQSDGVVA